MIGTKLLLLKVWLLGASKIHSIDPYIILIGVGADASLSLCSVNSIKYL